MIKHKLKITRSKGTSKVVKNGVSKRSSSGVRNGVRKQLIKVKLSHDQIEFLLFFRVIINYFLLLINHNTKPNIIKQTIVNLLKEIRNHNKYINKNTTDSQLDILYKKLYDSCKKLKKEIDNTKEKNALMNQIMAENTNNNINEDSGMEKIYTKGSTLKGKEGKEGKGKTKSNYQGGFYFKSMEEKGDQPITGNDIAKLLDEMQKFFGNAKYTEEGEFLTKTDTLLSMFRGDVDQFKGYVQWYILPKYYQYTPPFLKWDNIKAAIANRKYEDLPDYLLAYQSYLRSRDEYLVEKGVKSPSVLNKGLYSGFYDKISRKMDVGIQKYQRLRKMAHGQFTPLGLPM
uniref:Uncharacterized protein n=1 Tax=viral metagenome TaxID=1070528 RepID=A0A6C0F0N3_9ZZZZ